jgi:hypothetical protein
MSTLLSQSTTVLAPRASQQTNIPTPIAPARVTARPTILSAEMDPIMHRDDQLGYLSVPVYVQRWSDGYTILTFIVTTEQGDHTAHAWIDRNGGLALQIKSSRNKDRYTLSSTRCECVGFATHGHCRHLGASRKALAVVATWQFAQRQRARAAQREAAVWGYPSIRAAVQ